MTTRRTQLILAALTTVAFLMTAVSAPAFAEGPKYSKSQLDRARKINAAKIKKRRKASERNGAYVTGGLGLVGSGSAPADVSLSDGTGLTLGLGYRFTPQLAVEGDLLIAEYTRAAGEGETNNSDAGLLGATVGIKYFMPIDAPRIEGYGQFGLGILQIDGIADEDLQGTVVDIGGGVDYRLNKQFAIGAKVGYQHFLGDDSVDATVDQDFSSFNGMLMLSYEL
jgi:outer membrane protein W